LHEEGLGEEGMIVLSGLRINESWVARANGEMRPSPGKLSRLFGRYVGYVFSNYLYIA
jgi:hypothetical protein